MTNDEKNMNNSDNSSEFWEWAENNMPLSLLKKLQASSGLINLFLRQRKILPMSIFRLSNEDEVNRLAFQIKQIIANKNLRSSGLQLLSFYSKYLHIRSEASEDNNSVEQASANDQYPTVIYYNFHNCDDFERTLPYNCSIGGVSFEGKNWVQLYIGLIEYELKHHSKLLESLYTGSFTKKKAKNALLMDKKIEGLHCVQLSNGFWVNVNYSIPRLVYLIGELSCFLGYDKDSVVLSAIPKAESKTRKEITLGENHKDNNLGQLVSELSDFISNSRSGGVSKEDILKHFCNYKTHLINQALIECHTVKILNKYYSRNEISDYNEMADILLEVICKQFSQNGNYTSAQQLYNEARPRLDDFFFYNNAFDSRQEIYDLAVHLFEQERYKENSFIFMNNMHIWKEEPDYPKDYHGLMIKYAREHGNTFTREDALAYFEQIGSTTPAATFSNMIFNTGNKSFLQYAENKFVLTEAILINDYFLASVASQIENLLEGEDYIATGEIDDYFYTTLPALPSGIFWSALLLEDVLRIYEIGFTTIEAGKDNDKKTVPAAIVRKKSHYRSFSDVVWNEVSKAFPLPKEFTASEFREFLLNKGFIRGSEKMWSVHKTVAGDIRFYWTDNNGRVTIN